MSKGDWQPLKHRNANRKGTEYITPKIWGSNDGDRDRQLVFMVCGKSNELNPQLECGVQYILLFMLYIINIHAFTNPAMSHKIVEMKMHARWCYIWEKKFILSREPLSVNVV